MDNKFTRDKILDAICNMYIKKDVTYLYGYTSKKMVYQIQPDTQAEIMVGHRKVYHYLKEKLRQLKKQNTPVKAEIIESGNGTKNAILLEENKTVHGLVIEIQNEKIQRMNLVPINLIQQFNQSN